MFTRPRPGSYVLALVIVLCESPVASGQTITLPSGFCAEEILDDSVLSVVNGLSVSSDGKLYISDFGPSLPTTATVTVLDLSSGAISTLMSGLPLSAHGPLLVGNGTSLVGDDLIVADSNTVITGPCCDGAVLRVDRGDGTYTVLASGNPTYAPPGDPWGLALGTGGAFGDGLFVMDFMGASPNPPVLYTIDQNGVSSTFLTSPSVWTTQRNPGKIDFDTTGNYGGDLFVLDNSKVGGATAIWRVTPTAGLSAFVQGPLGSLGGIDFGSGGPFGTHMYVLETAPAPSSSTIYTVDPLGNLTPFATGLPGSTPSGGADLVFSPDGQALYVAVSDTIYRIRPSTILSYCTAGTAASGCQALSAAAGVASATSSSGFVLSVTKAEGGKDGTFFFGSNGRQANPWGNGTSYQCVVPPVLRTGLQVGVGTNGQCDGAFSIDLNALWCPTCPKPTKNPGAGSVVQAQLWYRDPFNTSSQTTSMSDAIEFCVGP